MRLAPIACVALLAIAVAAAIVPARAANVPPDCSADTQRFCAQELSGDELRCLRRNQASLLPACRRSLSAQAKAAARLCAAEIEQFCPDVQQAGGRLNKCIMPHHKELSPRCRSVAANL
jgi:hypothetical protein